MNVITKVSPDGAVSSCSAHCYNSTVKKCSCICKGLLHGKGEAYAHSGASRAALYLKRQNGDGSLFLIDPRLVPDMQGR